MLGFDIVKIYRVLPSVILTLEDFLERVVVNDCLYLAFYVHKIGKLTRIHPIIK